MAMITLMVISQNKTLAVIKRPRLSAAAEAGNSKATLASLYQRMVARASVGGLLGPNITAISTVERAYTKTTSTGNRIKG